MSDSAPAAGVPAGAAPTGEAATGGPPAWLVRARARWHRPFVNSVVAAEAMGWAHLLRASLPAGALTARRSHLLGAVKRARSPLLRAAVRSRMRPLIEDPERGGWRAHRVGWQRFFGDFGNIGAKRDLTSNVILKEPGPNGELGVLYCAFEYNMVRLMAYADLERLGREYLIVSESSYSPTDPAPYASWAGAAPHPVFLTMSNVSDGPLHAMLAPAVRSLPFMACDLTDPALFTPLPPAERDIDVLMVANWLSLKRHWLLFEALRRLPRDLRVVLIGRNAPPRTERTLRDEARAFGVRQELEILTNVPIDQVAAAQCRARVSPLLTDREGSCVSVAESLFADTPVVMMADAHVGSRAHINPRTGRIATRRTLWRHLAELMERPDSVSPRAWAMEHITAERTSVRLNAILRDYCVEQGLPWTQDIAPVCRRYVPQHLRAEDAERLAGAPARFAERYGIEVVQFRYS